MVNKRGSVPLFYYANRNTNKLNKDYPKDDL